MKILMVFAHPDDETFLLGGTTIKLTKAGHSVMLITATKGEAGLPGIPPITTIDKLPKVRERELKNATKITGIKQIYFLGEIDGTLYSIPTRKLVKKILPIMIKEQPDMVITFDKNGGTNHPDHKAISLASTESFRLYMKNVKKHVALYHSVIPKSNIEKIKRAGMEYKEFGEMIGTEDELITTVINIEKELSQKIKAMKCHKTQNKDWERILKRETAIDLNYEYLRLFSENLPV